MIIPLHYQIDIMNNTTLMVEVLLIDVVYIYYWMNFICIVETYLLLLTDENNLNRLVVEL